MTRPAGPEHTPTIEPGAPPPPPSPEPSGSGAKGSGKPTFGGILFVLILLGGLAAVVGFESHFWIDMFNWGWNVWGDAIDAIGD